MRKIRKRCACRKFAQGVATFISCVLITSLSPVPSFAYQYNITEASISSGASFSDSTLSFDGAFEPLFTSQSDSAPVSIEATISVAYVALTGEVDPQSTFALMDESGIELQKVSPNNGQVTFAPVSLPPSSLNKTYIYQIKGLGGDNPDIDYDTQTMRVLLTVSEDAAGKVKVTQETTESPCLLTNFLTEV